MLPPALPSRTGDLRLTRKKRGHPASKSFPVRLQPDISLIMTVFSKSDICYQILIERLLRGDGLCGAWTHHCPHPFRPLKGVQPSVVHILYATISSLGNVPGNEVAFLLSMTGKVPSLHPWSWVSPAINSPLLCQSPTRGLKSRQLTWTLLSLQEPLTAVPALPPMPQLPSQGGSGERVPGTEGSPHQELALCSLPSRRGALNLK